MRYLRYCQYRANVLNDYLRGYISREQASERLLLLDVQYEFNII